ncbi:hypothetical protein, partial [Novosphingobium gossypii]|uniref:hypothetical protein n=1 Tax=Novosphingobium gossypii TaxID=1604774 RepID=UPI003D2349BF
HVRFDEQGVETDRLASPTGAPHDTAPLPDSTDGDRVVFWTILPFARNSSNEKGGRRVSTKAKMVLS